MVKPWIKYIDKLSNKDKIIFRDIIQKIVLKNFNWLDIKKMSWNKEKYRCKVWNKRIIFEINNWIIEIIKIWPRWDVYKT
jgi:mRNA-degrading endonuclease RelE of RelBE toxin-antitoxin system